MHFVIHVASGIQIILGYLTVLMLGWLTAYCFLRPLVYIGEFCKAKPWRAFFTGLISVALLSGVTLLFAVSPFRFFLPVWYVFIGILFLYGLAVIALVVGESCLKLIVYTEHPWAEMFCGISVIFLLLMVPYIGVVLVAVLWLMGFGAAVKLKGGGRT